MKRPVLRCVLASARAVTLAVSLASFAVMAMAHEVVTSTIVIDHPYALETPITAMSGAGYMTITNTGEQSDRLVSVRAAFPRVTLHRTETDAQGITRMLAVDAIEIAPGETVTLAPWGTHVMFTGLDGDPFTEGERIPATLVFEQAGEIAIEFWVESRDGGGSGHQSHDQGSLGNVVDDGEGIETALFSIFGHAVQVGAFAIEGNAAVAGWRMDDEAGRAFLIRDGSGSWQVILLSGESLRYPASFNALGLDRHASVRLADAIETVEADDPAARAAYDAFRGTLFLAGS